MDISIQKIKILFYTNIKVRIWNIRIKSKNVEYHTKYSGCGNFAAHTCV